MPSIACCAAICLRSIRRRSSPFRPCSSTPPTGRTAFLSAALIGGGLLAMDTKPALAGLLFGAMAFKPHLALVDPVRAHLRPPMDDARHRRAATAAAFSAASLAAFGAPTWQGFFADAAFARSALENNLVGDEKMQSVFAAVRLMHGSLALRLGSADRGRARCVVAALWRLRAARLSDGGGGPPPSSAPACSRALSCSTTI